MICKAKTLTGQWVRGFLIGYYTNPEKTEIEKYSIFEGIDGVLPIPIDKDTICAYVCKDMNGRDAFIGDIVQLRKDNFHILCLLVKRDNGVGIYPDYQDGSLWRLSISRGVGNFTVWGNKFDNPDTLDFLNIKQEKFIKRTKDKWQNFST